MHRPTDRWKVRHKLKKQLLRVGCATNWSNLAIASYLAVCFGALLFYKAAILESAGIDMTRAGLAIIKALILGKFVPDFNT